MDRAVLQGYLFDRNNGRSNSTLYRLAYTTRIKIKGGTPTPTSSDVMLNQRRRKWEYRAIDRDLSIDRDKKEKGELSWNFDCFEGILHLYFFDVKHFLPFNRYLLYE